MLIAMQLTNLSPQDLCQQASTGLTHTHTSKHACVSWGLYNKGFAEFYFVHLHDHEGAIGALQTSSSHYNVVIPHITSKHVAYGLHCSCVQPLLVCDTA